MNRVYVVSQNIPNNNNMISGKTAWKFFYNKEHNNKPTWFSSDLDSDVIESPEETINYITNELKVSFYLRLIYD